MSKMLNVYLLLALILCITSGMMTKNFKTSANSQAQSFTQDNCGRAGGSCLLDRHCCSNRCGNNNKCK